MIEKGFFENAYINYDLDEITLLNTGVVDSKIMNHKVEMLVVTCNGCGANNQVERQEVKSCQYCGSFISG